MLISKLLITFVLFISLISQIQAQDNFYYSITGKISEISNVKKICVEYEIVGQKFDDCANVEKNSFSLKKQIVQPTSATISTDKTMIKPIKIFLGNTDFTFNITNEINFVTKPKLQIDFEKLTVMDTIRPNYFGYYSELNQKNDTQGLAKLSALFDTFKQADINIAYIYFKNNPKSLLSLFAFERFAVFQSDFISLETDFLQLPDWIKNSAGGKYISNKIEGAKAIAINKPAPIFSQLSNDNKQINLTDFRGKFVLLDFWASWCAPCRKEHPNLRKLYEKYKSRNFEIISVSIDEDKESWIKALNDDKLIWTNILNTKGQPNEIAVKYAIQAVPQNYLINPQGIIIAKNLKSEDLKKSLINLLK